MSAITVTNLTFGYDGSPDDVFEDVSFHFDTDWKLGFVGRNGRGKTTFMRLLLGEEKYSGTISSQVPFSYFPFPIGDETLNTIDIIDEINPNYEFWELCRELNLLDVAEDVLFRPYSTLSYGERTKTMLAVLFLKPDNFLLLDEPTNHLDVDGKQIVTDYLKSKKGFMLASHDRALLDDVTDHTLSINKANIEVVNASFSGWAEEKERRDKFEADENKKLKKDIAELKAEARRRANWSDKVEATKIGNGPVDRGNIGHKAAKMMKKAKIAEARQDRAIAEKASLLKNVEAQAALKLSPLDYHSNRLVAVKDLSIAYDEKVVLRALSFDVAKGERVAIVGGNGSGKSSLIKLILEVGTQVAGPKSPSYTGSVHVASGVKISYVPQGTSHLEGLVKDFSDARGVDKTLFLTILRHLGLERKEFESDITELSEGQKKKILIAASLSESAHLYIWDEPLNFIDIQSRMDIEALLLEYEPTMIFVEHDEVFTRKIATKTVVL
ncbi:MAG: ATP-binding cassette domain-containing protein [Clostridiales Family XIII bacterium]|nr:ATP-binding cassette domain-containing protein [Clostridiales Family XIII bacterium]